MVKNTFKCLFGGIRYTDKDILIGGAQRYKYVDICLYLQLSFYMTN